MRHDRSLDAAVQAARAARGARPAAGGAPRGWWIGLLLLWLGASGWLLAGSARAIATLSLPDSDDAMRLLQVRDWLAGQGWFDLRQHRLDPPVGGDIHWSRLVDLPLAAIIRPLAPLAGPAAAGATAAAIVPLLTLLAAMALLATIARRTIAPGAWWWPPVLLLTASPALGMMSPLRIDHHGWQIVAVLTLLLGLVTPDRRRGGTMAGIAIAASLAIGVEMLPFLVAGIALAVLGWARDADEAARLRALCAAATGGTIVALIAFVPPAQRGSGACDALSAAWAAPLLTGCAVLWLGTLAGPMPRRRAGPADRGATAPGRPAGRDPSGDAPQEGSPARFAAIAVALLAAGGAAWLSGGAACLVDPYHAVDPAARALWLDHVSEALPLWRQTAEVMWASLALPLIGLAGAAAMLARRRPGWFAIAALALLSIVLALAATRGTVVAQALALPGAAALGHGGREWLAQHRLLMVRVFGSVLLFLAVSAILPRLLIAATLGTPETKAETRADATAATCMAPATLAALDALPPATMLGFLDATPALLLHTHHRGIAGPYHRNGRAIADVMRAWAGTPAQAEAIVRRHRAGYVIACGEPAEARLYDTRAPDGFHARLMRGQAPPWLEPVFVTKHSWRVWRVRPLPGSPGAA